MNRRWRGAGVRWLTEFPIHEMLFPVSGKEIAYTLLGVEFYDKAWEYIDSHSMVLLGQKHSRGPHVVVDPMGGRKSFKAEFSQSNDDQYVLRGPKTSVPVLEPRSLPPVYGLLPKGARALVTHGVKVHLRRK